MMKEQSIAELRKIADEADAREMKFDGFAQKFENCTAVNTDAPVHEARQMPEMPIEMVSALAEGVEYVDATKLIAALLGHTKRLHDFVNVVGSSLIETQQSLIREHKKLIELEADMAAAGIGAKAEEKSALILPDRMKGH